MFYVICKDDDGRYVFARSSGFPTQGEADAYAATVAAERDPLVLMDDR